MMKKLAEYTKHYVQLRFSSDEEFKEFKSDGNYAQYLKIVKVSYIHDYMNPDFEIKFTDVTCEVLDEEVFKANNFG